MKVVGCGFHGCRNFGPEKVPASDSDSDSAEEEQFISVPVSPSNDGSTVVVHVAAGQSKTYFLTATGRVYDLTDEPPSEISFPSEERVCELSSGVDVFAAVTDSGAAFVWSVVFDMVEGKLGPSPPMRVSMPGGVKVRQVSLGNGFQLFLSTDGHVYSRGSNANGGLGLGSGTDEVVDVPQQVTLPEPTSTPIRWVSCQWASHAVAVSEKGAVLAWGCNARGQLGLGTLSGMEHTPQPVALLAAVVPIVSAVTSMHSTVLLSALGDVYAMGDYSSRSAVACVPTLIDTYRVVKPSKLVSDGRSPLGKRTLEEMERSEEADERDGEEKVEVEVHTLDEIQAIASGSGHTCLLRKDGHVLTFGKDYFGQCGKKPPFRDDEFVSQLLANSETRQQQESASDDMLVVDITPWLQPHIGVSAQVQKVACGYWNTYFMYQET